MAATSSVERAVPPSAELPATTPGDGEREREPPPPRSWELPRRRWPSTPLRELLRLLDCSSLIRKKSGSSPGPPRGPCSPRVRRPSAEPSLHGLFDLDRPRALASPWFSMRRPAEISTRRARIKPRRRFVGDLQDRGRLPSSAAREYARDSSVRMRRPPNLHRNSEVSSTNAAKK